MMMNVSHTLTKRAESQPEPDSKPPDPAQRTGAQLPAVVDWQLDQADMRRSWAYKLSVNKVGATTFIEPGIAMNHRAPTCVQRMVWHVRQATAKPGSGR
jgi:hypothetical protein